MPDVKLTVTGKDNKATSTVKGVTGSIIKAQIAVEALKVATKLLIDVGKKSIESLKIQEQAEAKLAAATGQNISEFKSFASQLQKVTTVGDETIIQAQTLASAMGIQNDQINQAVQDALGLSKALGIDLNASMKLTALATEGNYDALSRYIPAIRTATTDGEKQAIVQAAMAKGFKIAKAEADTFTGSLDQLSNIQGDNLEAFGKIISIVGESYVEGMKDAQTALNDFLTDSDKIGKTVGSFEVLKGILGDVGTEGFNALKEAVNPALEALKDLFSESEDGIEIFTILGGISQGLQSALTVMGKILKVFIIDNFISTIKIGKEVFDVFKALKDLATGKIGIDEVGDEFVDVFSTVKDVMKDTLDANVDVFKTIVDEGKSFIDGSKENADKYAQLWADTNAKIKSDFDKAQDDLVKKNKKTQDELEDDTEEGTKAQTKSWDSYVSSLGGAFTSAFSSISELSNSFFESIENSLSESLENQLALIEESTQSQLEMMGLQDLSKSESLQKEISELQSQMATSRSMKDKSRLRDELAEKKSELKKAKIVEEGEKQKDQAKKESAKKEFDLKIKAFNTQKALDLVTAGTQLALGIASAAASGAQFGPAAVAMIPLLVSLVTAAGAVGIATIASKQPPSAPAFATGVTGFSGGAAIVGEAGPELVTLGQGSNVLTNENTERILNNTGGGITINGPINVMANNIDEFVQSMVDVQEQEAGRV